MNLEQLIALGLDEDKAKEALNLHNEDVNGLKTKNTELLGKIDGYKGQMTEQEKAVQDARQVATEKEEARLKAEGDMEGLKKHYETQLAETTAQLSSEKETAQNALKQRDLSEVHSDIMRGVHENFTPAAQALLNANTEVSYGEGGVKKITIRHGEKEFNTTADFKEFAKSDPTWSAMLSAPNTQGVGAEGNKGGQAAVVSNEKANEAMKNGDAIGHANAHFSKAFNQ